MLYIAPITEKDYHYLVDWNDGKNADYLFQWAGHKTYHYPITIEQICLRSKEENSQIYMIFSDDKSIGSVEIDKISKEDLSANICRFILCDGEKSKGFGTLALKQLSNMVFTEMGFKKLTLGVFCYNVGAIRCYEKVGFLVKEYHQREDTKWNSYTMELTV